MVQADPIESWVTAYGREIHAYLWRTLGDPQDAEDCLQETFLRALRSRNRAAIREPRAWLYAIATNAARSQLRRRRREWAERTRLESEVAEPGDEGRRDRLEAVRRVVDALPEKQRQALLLRRYQGMSYQDVAAVLGGSPAAARANVYQAVLKLKRAFPEESR